MHILLRLLAVVLAGALATQASGCTDEQDAPPRPSATPSTSAPTMPAAMTLDQLINKLDVTLTAQEVAGVTGPPTDFHTWEQFTGQTLGSMMQLWHAFGAKTGVTLTRSLQSRMVFRQAIDTPCGQVAPTMAATYCYYDNMLYIPLTPMITGMDEEIGVSLAYFAWGFHAMPVELLHNSVEMSNARGELLLRCFIGVWAGTLQWRQKIAPGLDARWNADRLAHIRNTVAQKPSNPQASGVEAIDLGIRTRNPGKCLEYALKGGPAKGAAPRIITRFF